MTRIAEIIHGWLGWCPNGHMAKTGRYSDGGRGLPSSNLLPRSAGLPGSGGPVDPWDLHYEHTQPGYLLIGAIGATALFLTGTLILFGPELVQLLVLGSMIVVLAIMSRLKVSISKDMLMIRFGPVELIRQEWPLQEIVSVVPVKNPWYYGYGLRYTPHGPLYNVSGSGAVEIHLISGKTFRIGTDEPEALCAAVLQACSAVKPDGGGP